MIRATSFSDAIDAAVGEAMAADSRVVVIGEDVPMLRAPLFARFGSDRVIAAPISEAAFVGAAAGAAMAGLRPIVELMLVDFVGVAMDALLNQIAKVEAFSGGGWTCPLVVRAACGGGYGDGGQHEQALWGMLAGIPGLSVVVPATPADAHGLMAAAVAHEGPVVYLEHKLLSASWLDFMGRGGRDTVEFDVPEAGTRGPVSRRRGPVPIGKAVLRRRGQDVTVASLGVGVHRALEASEALESSGISCEVIDLRSVRPLDTSAIVDSVRRTRHLVVVDEDYRECGLSGELAAVALEAGTAPSFRRVCLEDTLPYARHLEAAALPSAERIEAAVTDVLEHRGLSGKWAAAPGRRKPSLTRTQGASICRHIGATEDTARRRFAAAAGHGSLSGQAPSGRRHRSQRRAPARGATLRSDRPFRDRGRSPVAGRPGAGTVGREPRWGRIPSSRWRPSRPLRSTSTRTPRPTRPAG